MAAMHSFRHAATSEVRPVCRLFQATPATASKLQACPFCGGSHVQSVQVDVAGWMVECFDCHTTGPLMDSVTSAVTAWNTRGATTV